MSLKLITLNIEGGRHLGMVLPFLQQEKADIICLQEVFKSDVPTIQKEVKMEGRFYPTAKVVKPVKECSLELRGVWGIALFTNLPHSTIQGEYYVGKGLIPIFHSPFNIDKVMVWSKVTKKRKEYTIGTTHFTWSHQGNSSKEQEKDFI